MKIRDVLNDKILVSRESARLLETPLRTILTNNENQPNTSNLSTFIIDFANVEGVAPSFLDELVRVLEPMIGLTTSGELKIANIPARLSSKFQAIARSHGLSIQSMSDGSWCLAAAQSAHGKSCLK